MMDGASFRFDDSGLSQGMKLFEFRAHAAVGMYANTSAKKLETYAKRNRPWTDRTGDARKLLTGYEQDLGDKWRVNLAHGVDYGIWLELANEKNYAIIQPTIDLVGPEIMQGLQGLLLRA